MRLDDRPQDVRSLEPRGLSASPPYEGSARYSALSPSRYRGVYRPDGGSLASAGIFQRGDYRLIFWIAQRQIFFYLSIIRQSIVRSLSTIECRFGLRVIRATDGDL